MDGQQKGPLVTAPNPSPNQLLGGGKIVAPAPAVAEVDTKLVPVEVMFRRSAAEMNFHRGLMAQSMKSTRQMRRDAERQLRKQLKSGAA